MGSAPTDRQAGGVLFLHACMAFRLTAALVALLLISRAAGAGSGQGTTNQDLSGEDAAAAFSLPAFLHQLTDIGGLRTRSKRRLTFTFSYFGDAFDNPVGGVKQGARL